VEVPMHDRVSPPHFFGGSETHVCRVLSLTGAR
jgi:hypothetical protein